MLFKIYATSTSESKYTRGTLAPCFRVKPYIIGKFIVFLSSVIAQKQVAYLRKYNKTKPFHLV